jgi:hypothetical protein
MVVNRKTAVSGSQWYVSYPAASRIPVGGVVVLSATTAGAETVAAAQAETSILGICDNRPEGLTKGKYDGFFEQYESVPLVDGVGYALAIPNGSDVNVDIGDFLEVAVLGDGTPGNHGLLEEAGSTTGTTFTVATVAKALQSVTMGSKSYKIPASDVAVGDTTVTMAAGEIATMGIAVGDYICLEDITGNCQTNRVAGLTSIIITLEIPSTVVLENSANDLVTRCYPVLVKLVK